MRRLRILAGIAAAVLLAGCGTDLSARYGQTVLERVAPATPSPETLVYCTGHGCAERHPLPLGPSEWRAIALQFEPPAADAAEERRRLAAAAAVFETIAGRRTESDDDRAGTFGGFGRSGQLDCIDEAINMTQLARLLSAQGLLHHHRPDLPVQRGHMLDSWPHYAASLREESSGRSYVLDGWYRDNGEQALVLPVEVWRAGVDEPLLTCLRAEEAQDGKAAAGASLCYES